MPHTSDIRVLGYEPLLAPAALLAELPLGAREAKHVEQARAEVRAVLTGIDDRLLVVAGPCSVHDPAAALDYAERLAAELEVDGGIKPENAARVVAAGATVLVAGSAVFEDPDGPASALRKFKQAIRG